MADSEAVNHFCIRIKNVSRYYPPQSSRNDNLDLPICTSGRPLKITMVLAWPIFNQKGGAERILCELSDELLRRGHNVTVLCADKLQGKPAYPVNPLVRFEHFGGAPLPLSHLKFFRGVRSWRPQKEVRRTLRHFSGLDAAAAKLKLSAKRFETDVYITFSAYGTYILKKAIGQTAPVITMFHSTPEFVYGEPLGVQEAHSNKWDLLKNRSIRDWFDNFLATVASSNIVQVLMPEFVEPTRKALPGSNVVCIPNPVPQYIEPADLKKHTIINVARIVPLKRQHLIVEAFALLAKRFPDWTVELWGQTNDRYCDDVRQLIDKLGLTDRVKICGVTTNIEQKLANASVLVMASELEGFCLGMVEAMAKGLPVIGCTNCKAVNTIIRDEENGLLCEDTPNAMATALSRLMENEELRKRLGTRGREDAKSFAPHLIWDQWESLLQSVAIKIG